MGFALPVAQWINTRWLDMSQELVLGDRASKRGYFNMAYLENIISEHRRNRRDHSYIIWTLMMLEMWLRNRDELK
jgi:asparagine synthase (glutamine-hydrolysing)